MLNTKRLSDKQLKQSKAHLGVGWKHKIGICFAGEFDLFFRGDVTIRTYKYNDVHRMWEFCIGSTEEPFIFVCSSTLPNLKRKAHKRVTEEMNRFCEVLSWMRLKK